MVTAMKYRSASGATPIVWPTAMEATTGPCSEKVRTDGRGTRPTRSGARLHVKTPIGRAAASQIVSTRPGVY